MNLKLYWANSKAYTNNILWPLIVNGRKPIFKQMATETGQVLAKGLVLDIGTGQAYLPEELAKNYRNTQVIGIDISSELINAAYKRTFKNKLSSRVSLFLASAESLPFSDNTFDIVHSMFSFHQWQNKQRGMIEIYRVLKPGGQATILVGKQYLLSGFLRWFYFFSKRPISDISIMCQKAGFKNIEIKPFEAVNAGLRISLIK
jgi:ubiquinone/menaquinone biosynthesis C-methylase UbiE